MHIIHSSPGLQGGRIYDMDMDDSITCTKLLMSGTVMLWRRCFSLDGGHIDIGFVVISIIFATHGAHLLGTEPFDEVYQTYCTSGFPYV